MIELTDTNAGGIASALMHARKKAGSPAMGMVMTLVVVVDEDDAPDAMEAARAASQEHPARVLGVVLGDARGKGTINAQVGTGSGWSGEHALIRLKGEVVKHPESVVLPLLLPDSPVACWWPSDAPEDPASDPLGALAQRRITDTAAARRARTKALHRQCASYAEGNTDLAWTRLTPWRALLAAALDQHPEKVRSASVTAERVSPSADLLVAWLEARLRVTTERLTSKGPGITEAVLVTKSGEIRIERPDGKLAQFISPGQPDRPVALKRRDIPELLSEELRRLDEDDVYAQVAKRLAKGREEAGLVTDVAVLDDAGELVRVVSERFVSRLAEIQKGGRVPHVVLTGGTIADELYQAVAASDSSAVDWQRVSFWWGDERYVAADSDDRNERCARRYLLDVVGASQVHAMPASDSGRPSLSAAASAYEGEVRASGAGAFDLVLLGMGPDGHVASLFPGFEQLDVDDRLAVSVTDSPKPPPDRISLTFPALNRSREVWFLVSGEGKADAVARALAPQGDPHETPARGIHPETSEGPGVVTWFLDRPASGGFVHSK